MSPPNSPRASRLHNQWKQLVLLGLLPISLGAGCVSNKWITLRKTPQNPLTESLKFFSPGGPKPTERTLQLLRHYAVLEDSSGNRRKSLTKLQQIYDRQQTPDTLYALAELAYMEARKTELINKKAALDLYGISVVHAYLYLFEQIAPTGHNFYDPRFRGACDLYNASLEATLRIAQHQGKLLPGHAYTIQTASKKIDVSVQLRSSGWHEDEFDRFEFVSDYQVHGLTNHYHTYGLGVPLIAIRKTCETKAPSEQFYPQNLSFPVTAFLRTIPDSKTNQSEGPHHLHAVLELYDPLVSPTISVAGRHVPLESDLSTPLAYFLSQPQFDENRLASLGFLDPEEAKSLQGLYMMEPYQTGKIPVVMVHGLWSSPVTWMEMFNDLRSDPEIRQYYQFWFYLYPTGQPIWQSGTQMRADLAHARSTLDPHKREPSLDQTILVGHSMGGLVAKLQTVDSGDDFWKILSDKSLRELKAETTVRATLKRLFYFHPNPSVRRVVTIGTPHRGSRFANDATRWMARKLITVPSRILQGKQGLLRDNPKYFHKTTLLTIDTSIDSLDPDSPFLPVLLNASKAPWTSYHNVVGKVDDPGFFGRFNGEGDGVVRLASAQLDEVTSQITVNAEHSHIHRHPRTILEIRRILLEHLRSLRSLPNRIEHLPPLTTSPGGQPDKPWSYLGKKPSQLVSPTTYVPQKFSTHPNNSAK